MTVLYKYLETAVSAVERHPLIRQNFSDLGVVHRVVPPMQRKEVFERLGRVLKSDPENPLIYLNLAFFAAAANRYDIAEVFSFAACNFKKGKSGLKPEDRIIAENVYNSSKAKTHRSDEVHNPLVAAAKECGVIKPSTP
ncbi:MAG: hypothetical protein DYH13_06525 [Alphaproteobacteria bacterium PRO2]|nr:hypothetical protein [Alphaproteobacteria bacterium PRO2]